MFSDFVIYIKQSREQVQSLLNMSICALKPGNPEKLSKYFSGHVSHTHWMYRYASPAYSCELTRLFQPGVTQAACLSI